MHKFLRTLGILATLPTLLALGGCIDAAAPGASTRPTADATSAIESPGAIETRTPKPSNATDAPRATTAPAEPVDTPRASDAPALAANEIDALLGDTTPKALMAEVGDMGLGARRDRAADVCLYELTGDAVRVELEADWEEWMGTSEPSEELDMRIRRVTWLGASACDWREPPRGVRMGASKQAVLDAYPSLGASPDAGDPLVGGFAYARGAYTGPEDVDFEECILYRCAGGAFGHDAAPSYRYAAYYLSGGAVVAIDVGVSRDGT